MTLRARHAVRLLATAALLARLPADVLAQAPERDDAGASVARDSMPTPPPADASPVDAPASEASAEVGVADGATPEDPDDGASPAAETAHTPTAEDRPDESDAALLAELGLDGTSSESGVEPEDRFRIYGFVDLGANALYFPRASIVGDAVPYRAPTFVLGNLNLYFDGRPSPDWHMLAEVRFTAYPHGTSEFEGTRLTTASTSVLDVTSSTGRNSVNWGGIVLERVYGEWTRHDAFRVRAGLFLTPYGIWNVDHGTPTLLGLILPTFIAEEYLPLRQTGVQVDGHFQLDRGDFDYTLYVSNGRPQGLFDVDLDKAFGGRVRYATGDATRVVVGGSFYVGDSSTQEKVLSVGPGGARLTTDTLVAYRDWALAADLSIDGRRFGLRSELVMRDIRYDDDARAPVPFGAPGTFEPDSREYTWYAAPFVRHRRLTPYLWYEYTRGSLGARQNTRMLFSAGLNVDFTPSVQLKTQLGYYAFYEWDDSIRRADVDSNFYLATTRLVMAF